MDRHVIKLACSPPKRKCSTRKQIKSRSFLYKQGIRTLELDGLMCFRKAYSRLHGFVYRRVFLPRYGMAVPGGRSEWPHAGQGARLHLLPPALQPYPVRSSIPQAPSLVQQRALVAVILRLTDFIPPTAFLCGAFQGFPERCLVSPPNVSAEWILCVAKCLLVSFNLRHRYHLTTFLLCLWAWGPLPAASRERV